MAFPERPGFPELPRSAEEASRLIQHRTERPPPAADTELTADVLLDAASKRGWAALVTGEDRVVGWIQAFLDRASAARRDAYVLFGTYHDAGGQVDAFRRLIGPGGLRGLTLVAVEPFRATGAWRGVAPEAQRGDDTEIAAYVERGDRAAFEALAARHRESDYAAWKFGYMPSVMELLVTARATGTAFAGCDMPGTLQQLVSAAAANDRLRLREIHCLASLAHHARSGSPRRVAMLWGQAHVRAGGMRRFLPPGADVLAIDVLGFRAGDWTLETQLAKRLVLADPVLIPLDDSAAEVALLYPDSVLGGTIDRVFSSEPGPPGLHVRIEGSGLLTVGNRSFPVGPESRSIELRDSDRSFVIDAGGLRLVGAIVPAGSLELRFDPHDRSVVRLERPRH